MKQRPFGMPKNYATLICPNSGKSMDADPPSSEGRLGIGMKTEIGIKKPKFRKRVYGLDGMASV